MAARWCDMGVRNGGDCVKVGLLTPAIGSRNSGDALIESAIRRMVPANEFRRFGIRTPLGATEMTSLNECDVAILCGSNLYQAKPQMALDREFVNRLTIPLVPLGVGASAAPGELPNVDGAMAETIRAVHSRCAASSVRDPATLRFLEGIGIDNARLTGCPVFFHGLVRPEFQFGEAPPTLSLRQTFLHGAERLEFRQEPLLEMICRAHRPKLVCQGPADLSQAKRLARRYGLEFLYDDEWQCDIHEWLAKRQAWTGGFRLHHGMLALSYGRPAWFVSHDSRIDEFARMVGLDAPDIRSATPMDVESWGCPETLPTFEPVAARWDTLVREMGEVLRLNGLPCALGEARPEKPKVLFLVPRRNWAYDFSARSIQTRVEARVDVRIRYSTDEPVLRPEPYALAVVFFWAEKTYLGRGFDPNRIVKVVSSHRWEHPGKHGPLSPSGFAERYLSDAGTVWTTSRRLEDLLKNEHPRVRYTPNGFEPECFRPIGDRKGPLRIGAAGWIGDAVKGYEEILLPAVQGMDFKLADGSFPHERMNAFYNEIDVLAVTSAHEGEPLTLIESMAAGCFPVCSDVGIVRELIRHGENGLIVKDRTVQAFREAFEWCKAHVDQVRQAGRQNARDVVNARSWEGLVTNFEEQMREAMRFADQPRFLIGGEDPSACAAEALRLNILLSSYRQHGIGIQASNSDPSVIDLAEDVKSGDRPEGGWRMKPGSLYQINLDSSGPVDLGWLGVERVLAGALQPRPDPRFPLLHRVMAAVRRRLAGFQGGEGV